MKFIIASPGKTRSKLVEKSIQRYRKILPKSWELNTDFFSKNPDGFLQYIKNRKRTDYIIKCDRKGTQFSSEELAALLEDKVKERKKRIIFFIGNESGFGQEDLTQDITLSFSRMTFTHEHLRLLASEQIYRSVNIINQTSYHK